MSKLVFATLWLGMFVPCLAAEVGPPERKPVATDPFGAPAAPESQQPAAKQTHAAKPENPFGATHAPVTGGHAPAKIPAAKPHTGKDPFGPGVPGAPSPKSPRDTADHSRLPPAPAYPRIATESPAASAARARIETELAKPTTIEYVDQRLKDVVDDVSFRHAIPIQLDTRPLEDFGISRDEEISLSLKNITLRSALRLMLDQLELTYVIRDEVLLITTRECAEQRQTTLLYPVSELLPEDGDGVFLVKLIEANVAPESWDAVGGAGKIAYIQHLKTLVISQQEDVFPEIDGLLAALKKRAEEGSPDRRARTGAHFGGGGTPF